MTETEHLEDNPILKCCNNLEEILDTGMPLYWKTNTCLDILTDFMASQGYVDIQKLMHRLADQQLMTNQTMEHV